MHHKARLVLIIFEPESLERYLASILNKSIEQYLE